MIARALITLVVIGVIIGVIRLNRGPGVSGAPSATERTGEAPGYAARDAEVIETDSDGRALYTLRADVIRQHPNDDRVQLDSPRLIFVASDGNAWHAQAQSGEIRDDGTHIDLSGDVHVKGELAGTQVPAIFDTSTLSVDTRQEVISTDAPVTLDWGGRKLAAVGLVARLNEQQVTLESRVHGSFAPK